MGTGVLTRMIATGRADKFCRCGEVVTPQRTGSAIVYYCHDCGHDWTEPTAVQPVKFWPPKAKKCECANKCHRCGKGRGTEKRS